MNADKRRCVEIALKEFAALSDVQIGKLCGVADRTVASYRPVNLENFEVEKRTGADGKVRAMPRTARDERKRRADGLRPSLRARPCHVHGTAQAFVVARPRSSNVIDPGDRQVWRHDARQRLVR
ncbi:MAG: hypothetical protein L6455_07410 [Kiritimatiellae bacterium]|nr:hypothetical protein [Verrucomicrobiota bacterium]MBU4290759.1 hypothetical protein [Verrucomicrobiota bacterium]MCG2679777.1 hypothetical protein [Kiritimatiellia bacterium]